jgi:hypothetical protein
LAVPPIREVRKDEWDKMKPPFTAIDGLRVKRDGQDGYDLYVNLDNTFLLTELSRSGEGEKALFKYWFKYGLALCALGMLQHYRTNNAHDRGALSGDTQGQSADNVGDHVELVNQTMSGIARVIIPIVRRLYRGPT